MKVRRVFIGALGVMALASVTVFGATSSAHSAKREGGMQGLDRRGGPVCHRSSDAAGR